MNYKRGQANCALKHKSALLSLDRGMLDAAEVAGVRIKEVSL